MMQNTYNTGDRIPREKIHDQDERLTNKHLQTLQFVQEVVRENKELKKRVEELELQQESCKELHALAEESKEKIKTLQEQYLRRADEINAMLAEKHRSELMKINNDKIDQEQQYCEQIVQLKQEISGLQNTNEELMGRVSILAETQEKVEELNLEIDHLNRTITKLQTEIDTLLLDKQNLSEEKASQFSQLQDLLELRNKNESLSQELKSMGHKNTELQHKVRKLDLDLKEAELTKDHKELIDQLKNKLAKVHKERAVGLEKESYYEKMVSDLKYELKELKDKLSKVELTKERILDEYYKIHSELQHLKKNYALDSKNKTFKDFVKLKREIAVLKDENMELKRDAGMPSNFSSHSLPMLRYEPPVKVENPLNDKKKKAPQHFQSLKGK